MPAYRIEASGLESWDVVRTIDGYRPVKGESHTIASNVADRLNTGRGSGSGECDEVADNIAKNAKPPQCIFVPGRTGIIDILRPDGRSGVYGETLEEVRKRYPNAQIGDLDTVARETEDSFREPPKRIPYEHFLQMLECLPPENWVREKDCESFKMCERTYGNITAILVRIGDSYFEMQDSFRMPHARIIELCKEAVANGA